VILQLFKHRQTTQLSGAAFGSAMNLSWRATLQRQNAENLKQIFPEKEYRSLSPNFHIHVSVSE
jgi:hypothetical protein